MKPHQGLRQGFGTLVPIQLQIDLPLHTNCHHAKIYYDASAFLPLSVRFRSDDQYVLVK